MTFYRVALQAKQARTWQWKSTILSSLEAVFGWLRMYQSLPPEHLRVFSSASREDLDEQLMWENQGFSSPSVTAAQFLQARGRTIPGVAREELVQATPMHMRTAALVVAVPASWGGREMGRAALSASEWKREEFERGAGGDHDAPYRFTLPNSMPQALAWVKLLVRVRNGELQL